MRTLKNDPVHSSVLIDYKHGKWIGINNAARFHPHWLYTDTSTLYWTSNNILNVANLYYIQISEKTEDPKTMWNYRFVYFLI